MSFSGLNETDVKNIVEQVVSRISNSRTAPQPSIPRIDSTPAASAGDGIFETVDEAFQAAARAFDALSGMTLKKRGEIIDAYRVMCRKELESLAREAVQETGFGRVEDKIKKNALAVEKTPGIEDIQPEVFTGDHGLTLRERAPFGVIAAITPSTNPAATVINNGISMVAAGNTVVFNCHPSARNVSLRTVAMMNRASVSVGGPPDIVTAIASPTMETSKAVMNHAMARVVVVTGGGAVVKEAFRSGKKVFAAGPGNPPVVVDETADLERAGRDIVNGASFDNNILCTAEKELIAVESSADRLKEIMLKSGAFEVKGNDIARLEKAVLTTDGRPNRKLIGRNAGVILREIGMSAGDNTRLIICETSREHPFVWTEMLLPVLPIVRVRNVAEAIDFACEAEKGNLHTAVMHSRNIDNLHTLARKINSTIFVKNGPSYSGLGFEGEGPTTLTICTPTGEGITTAKTFTRLRNCVLKDYFRIV